MKTSTRITRIPTGGEKLDLDYCEGDIIVREESGMVVGAIRPEIVEGNVVITVFRYDEAYFGPVSLVVV